MDEEVLKTKDLQIEQERQQKEQLATLIQELEKKLVSGGQALQEKERDQLSKKREMQL